MENQVPDNISKLFVLFKQAVEEERRAQAMYREAIDLCTDEVTRDALKDLYADELRHERELVQRYNALRKEFGVE